MRRRVIKDKNVDANTLLLLHFDGNLKDKVTGKYCTNHGSTISSDGKFSQGLDVKSGSYISLEGLSDYYPGTNDFTVDFYIKVRSNSSKYPAIYASSYRSYNGFLILSRHYDDNYNSWWISSTSDNASELTKAVKSSTSTANNKHTHFALVRKSGIFYLYLNGVLNTSKYNGINITCPINKMTIGNFIVDGVSYADAIISEFRISNIARWTSNFTPPTKPY